MPAALNFSEYPGIDDLPESHVRAWRDAARGTFYGGPAWYRNLMTTTRDEGDNFRVYAIEQKDGLSEPVAILLTRWNPSVKNYFAGRLLRGLTGPYSCEFGVLPLGEQSDTEEAMTLIASRLYASEPRWDALRFDAIPKETGELDAFIRAVRNAGFLVQPFFHFGNWYENVDGVSFESYLANRPTRLRNTLRRREKRMLRAGASRVHVFEHLNELPQGLQAYEYVYARSWKTPEPYPQFVPGLMEAAARFGCLRLGVLYLDEEPVAAQIWLVSGERATIFKLAYTEAQKELSVGSLLTSAMVKRILDEKDIREIDFGRGDDVYKKDWMSSRRERWGFMAFHPRTPRGLLGAARHLGGYQLKRKWAAFRNLVRP